MTALGNPLALLGLLAVPVVLWLHRRRRRAVPVVVPSLLFLEGEEDRPAAPDRFRLDADALLAAAAAALLALAAAAPRVAAGTPGRTVRVVVDEGPAMGGGLPARGTPYGRALDAVERIRDALGPGDAIEVVPARPPRLLEAARGGAASLRVLVTDRVPAGAAPDVRVVAVGDPARRNLGILAVDVEDREGERRVLVTVGNDRDEEATVPLEVGGERVEVRVPARGAASVERRRPVPAGPARLVEQVRLAGDAAGTDPQPLDDAVALDARPVLVAFAGPAEGLPAAHADAVRRALEAVAPGRWREVPAGAAEVTLHVVAGSRPASSSAEVVLRLHPVSSGAEVRRPPGAAFRPPPPAAFEAGRDLDATGCDLRYDPAVARGAPPFPLVEVSGVAPGRPGGEVDFAPDPLLGSPAPVEHPIWPLLVENVVASVRGRAGASGWSAHGTLDPYVTFPGHDVAPFQPAWLDAAPRDRRPRETPLAPWLAGGAAVCLLLLWVVPRGRRR